MHTITICGSMNFFSEITQLKKELEHMGFKVFTPTEEGTGTDYSKLTVEEQADMKQNFIDTHNEKIKKSDAILLANYTKQDIKDYIGANTFLEMAVAYILKKPIFLLNTIPEQPNTVEIRGLKPIPLHGNVQTLKEYK